MNYKNLFIKHCIEKEALKFGQFNLKSGRVSPFFLTVESSPIANQ